MTKNSFRLRSLAPSSSPTIAKIRPNTIPNIMLPAVDMIDSKYAGIEGEIDNVDGTSKLVVVGCLHASRVHISGEY